MYLCFAEDHDEETAEGGGGGGGGGAGQDPARNLGARAARQLLREGVRQNGKLTVDGDRQRRHEEKRGGGDNDEVLRTETGGDRLEPRFGEVGAKEAGGILDAAIFSTG